MVTSSLGIVAEDIAGARLGANRGGQCRFSATTGEPFGRLQLSFASLVRCDGMEEVRGSNPLSSTHLTRRYVCEPMVSELVRRRLPAKVRQSKGGRSDEAARGQINCHRTLVDDDPSQLRSIKRATACT